MRSLVVLGLLALLLCPAAATAEDKPVQLALFDPAQVFDRDTSVRGLRLNLIYGYNRELRGLDLGLVNRTSGTTKGLQYGLVGVAEADFSATGTQLTLLNEGVTGWRRVVAREEGASTISVTMLEMTAELSVEVLP